MPTIAFATSKGGAGKTTSTIVLSTTLARGTRVEIIDADPAHRTQYWAEAGDIPDNLRVTFSKGTNEIQDEIDRARSRATFVILDLEGSATELNSLIMAESDLVIIPTGDEQQDAKAASDTLREVRRRGRAQRREIPTAILFARTKAAVKSALAKEVNRSLREATTCFETELVDRTGFSSLHNLGGDLYSMKGVGGVDKAIANAENFAGEVVAMLKEIRHAQTA